jgi:hypothetical protein
MSSMVNHNGSKKTKTWYYCNCEGLLMSSTKHETKYKTKLEKKLHNLKYTTQLDNKSKKGIEI